MMKKYIKPYVVSVATISEGCLLAGTGGAGTGQFGHAKSKAILTKTELESDQKEHTEN